ncbi:MAG TPA: protease inhibitor I9 family protein, partial [Anaeromyxobacter sp.]|nr:protease inhibitor I9 family protein [Anaeromyxobacter sp.]
MNGGAAPNRFVAPDAGALESVRPVFVPLGLRNADTTVVLQLGDDPVAVASANALAPFTRAEKDAHKGRLRAQQRPVEDEVRARGGTVLSSFQSAYNGVKVQISASKASALASIPGVVAVHPVRTYRPDNTHGVPLIGAPFV